MGTNQVLAGGDRVGSVVDEGNSHVANVTERPENAPLFRLIRGTLLCAGSDKDCPCLFRFPSLEGTKDSIALW